MAGKPISPGDLPIDAFVQAITTIYAHHDRKRSIWDCWFHAQHHAAGVAEHVRKGILDGPLFDELADFAMWVFTMVSKRGAPLGQPQDWEVRQEEALVRVSKPLSGLLWTKFPGACPWCATRSTITQAHYVRPCICQDDSGVTAHPSRKVLDTVWVDYATAHGHHTPPTIDAWQTLFGTVYSQRLERLDPRSLALHLLEEVGEVSDAIVRTYSYIEGELKAGAPNHREARLGGAVSDVVSLLFGVASR